MAQLLAADGVIVDIPTSVRAMMTNLPAPLPSQAAVAAPFWASDIDTFVDFCLAPTRAPASAKALMDLVIVAEIAHWNGAQDAMKIARDEILGALKSKPLDNAVHPRIRQLYSELL